MINLKKGSSISLEKDGQKLEHVYIGLNWGKIKKFWGIVEENVDLDGSVTLFNASGSDVDTVYFQKKMSDDGAIMHSGDDRSGDSSKDDKDNEVISINLNKVSPNVQTIVVYLNSYQGHDFDSIPYANIRLLNGDAIQQKGTFALYNLASDPKFKDKVSMVMAKLVRSGAGWTFVTIGDAVNAKRIGDTINVIKQHYL
jgi:tellurium resistance protein TerZ